MESKNSEKKSKEVKLATMPLRKVQTAEGWKRMMQKKQKTIKHKGQ